MVGSILDSGLVDSVEYMVKDMPQSYANICWLLLAERFRKSNYFHRSLDIVDANLSDYWRKSWLNWYNYNHK